MKRLVATIIAITTLTTIPTYGAELVTDFYKNEFPVGTNINFDNMHIKDEGQIIQITEDMVGAYNRNKLGRQFINIRYKDQVFQFAVNFVTSEPPEGMLADGTINPRGGPYNLIISSLPNTIANEVLTIEGKSSDISTVPAYTGADGREYVSSIFTRENYGFRVFGNSNLDYYTKAVKCPLVDISNAWYTDTIKDVYSRGLMIGLSKYEFKPNKTLTRAELAYLLYRFNNNPESSDANYKYKGQWYSKAVCWLYNDVLDVGANRLDMQASVTREEVAYTLYKLFNFERTSPTFNVSDFYDTSESKVKSEIHTLKEVGLMNGDTENNFHPKANLSRAEMTTILMNCIKYKVDSLDS